MEQIILTIFNHYVGAAIAVNGNLFMNTQTFLNNLKAERPPMVCPECFGPVKRIAGGISRRTGNKYSTFYACKNCEFTYNKPNLAELKKSLIQEALVEQELSAQFYANNKS